MHHNVSMHALRVECRVCSVMLGLTWPLKVHLVGGGNVGVGASQVDGRDGSRRVINGVIREKISWIPPHHEGLIDERVDTVKYTIHTQSTICIL